MLNYICKNSAYFLVPHEPKDYETKQELERYFREGAIFRVAGCTTLCTIFDFIGITVPIYFNNLTEFVILEIQDDNSNK